MKRTTKLAVLFLIPVVMVFGCSDESDQPSKASTYNRSNQKSVDNLSALFVEHPEVAKASLKDIKESAARSKGGEESARGILMNAESFSVLGHGYNATSLEDVRRSTASQPLLAQPVELDPDVAKKTQDLIEKALDEFDFQVQIEASFKIVGIVLNMQKEMFRSFESGMKELEAVHKDSGFASTMPEGAAPKELSCKEFIENPFMTKDKEKYDKATVANKALIKNTLSGCPKIKAGDFLQCIQDFNRFFSLVNEHASCDMKSLKDLDDKLNEATDGKMDDLGKSVSSCMEKQFGSCGFTPHDPDKFKDEQITDKNNVSKEMH